VLLLLLLSPYMPRRRRAWEVALVVSAAAVGVVEVVDVLGVVVEVVLEVEVVVVMTVVVGVVGPIVQLGPVYGSTHHSQASPYVVEVKHEHEGMDAPVCTTHWPCPEQTGSPGHSRTSQPTPSKPALHTHSELSVWLL